MNTVLRAHYTECFVQVVEESLNKIERILQIIDKADMHPVFKWDLRMEARRSWKHTLSSIASADQKAAEIARERFRGRIQKLHFY